MAVLASIATGNFTAAGTWQVVNATSYVNAETNSDVLTTAYSGTRSAAFTPGAITVSHLGVKLSVRTGTTGTMSVSLRNATIGLNDFVAGTEVTINTADLPVAATADANGGWVFFKLATPVLLLAATNYNIQSKTSSATQVSLFRDGTADNSSRCLVTTTTGAPAAGDDLIIGGEYTGTGTSNSFTVTMDNTALTDFGSASTSLVTPALAICSKGTLTWGVAAATAYKLKLSGNLIEYSGGVHNKGTVANPTPRDSSTEIIFDCAANVDFGHTVRNLGTYIDQGQSRTSGKNIYYCKLNTDEAIASTSLGVDTDTGWLDNDEIAVASTTQTMSQSEKGSLNGAAGASTLTVDGFLGAGGGLAAAHSGTSPTQAEVILLTRNSVTRGTSATLQSYIDVKATATVDIDWAEFYWLGSAVALKGGIQTATTTGSFDIKYSSLHDFVVTGSDGIVISGASGGTNHVVIQYCVFYNINSAHFSNIATTATWTVDNCIFMKNVAAIQSISIADLGGTFTNNTVISGNAQYSIHFNEIAVATGTFSNITAHSNQFGILVQNAIGLTISNITSWRNATGGIHFNATSTNITINTATLFGNGTANIYLISGANPLNLALNDFVCSGDSTFATASGIHVITNLGAHGEISINNSTFGVASGIKVAHSTGDINCPAFSSQKIVLNNCLLSSATEVATQANLVEGSYIASQKHDQTNGLHKTWKPEGTLVFETTAGLYDSTPSLRMTPLSASKKLTSKGRWGAICFGAVTNGNTLTVSVKVRESVAGDGTDYNGNRVRLIVKRNEAAGITADTVLATATGASVGAFETISGTTPAVTDDAVLDFEVDCDGTTGWVNVDSWTITGQYETKGLQFWQDGQPVSYGDNSAGGGGSTSHTFS